MIVMLLSKNLNKTPAAVKQRGFIISFDKTTIRQSKLVSCREWLRQ